MISLSGRGGQSWLNFIVERVTDPSAELQKFKEQGYSSHFVITKAYLGVRVGSGHSD